ncbi:MAG: MBL fold metallo-hydrolase [Nitrospiraceae bacterium]|nr:MBL fold metallo-hydrolase [Nitrospiraceae bacterium]
MKNVNLSKPIEIAPDTFWIGHYLPNISLQCHTYLIRKGNESAIIDPGGIATFPYVLQKMTQLIKLGDVKYLILSHQDPDIVGCVPMLENVLPPRENRLIVTHWRTFTLLRYLSLKTHFYLIDNNGWKLKLPDRTLEFVFTPYASLCRIILHL